MVSFRSVVAATFVAVAAADYSIDPSSVSLGTRQNWCQDEKRQCPLICRQEDPRPALVNDCDPKTLTYGCLCGNNKQPNISEFSLTMPYYICQEWGNQCVKQCGINNACSSNCREQNPCGAKNPTRLNNTSTVKPQASQTDSAGTIYTDTPGSSKNQGDNSKGAAAALEVGRSYGLTVVFITLFAGFAML